MPGRRPSPTALKIASGNPGKRAMNKREPKVEPGVPQPADHLSDGARQAWFALAPMLDAMNVLTKADAIELEILCEVYVEWQELKADIAKNGRTQDVTTKGGGTFTRQRPQVAMLQDCDRRLRGHLSEFGLSPASRSKISVAEKSDNEDEFFNGA